MMDLLQWRQIANGIADDLYEAMEAKIGCGPFDGGCTLFARALKQIYGGEVVVVTTPDNMAQHAALAVGNVLWDFDGPKQSDLFLRSYNAKERAFLDQPCVGYRAINAGDLPDCPSDQELEGELVSMIKCQMTTLLVQKLNLNERRLNTDPTASMPMAFGM